MRPLRVLFVEDSEDDVLLIRRLLGKAGYEVHSERIQSEDAMRGALLRQAWDVVIADHSMPEFSSLDALRLVQSVGMDLPFLIVSGSIPEDLAVTAMKAGASDFLTKQQLARLVPAIERELREVGERKRHRDSEQRVQRSEERYRRFFEDDLTGDVLTDADGAIVDSNPAFRRMFGFPSVIATQGSPFAALFVSPRAAQDLVARVREEHSVVAHEAEMRRRDGTSVFVVGNVVGEFADSGELAGLRGYFFDVTERRELENQLRHAQKMEAVGRLAGGIAHDFNNLLTAIAGYTDLSLRIAGDTGPLHKYQVEVKRATDRATLLTRRLLAFSRRQLVQAEPLDLRAIVADLEGMLERLLREDVRLELDVDPETPWILGDRGHVDQVLVNLVVNARDAQPAGGSIRIRTRAVPDAPGATEDVDVPRGRYALVAVADDGVGMTPEVAAHVFEPFFTTKGADKGTGLGLATVYGIVEQAKGHVRFTTRPGAGTEFRVYWPVAEATREGAARPAGETPADADVSADRKTILVVEDNLLVRGALVELFRRAGHQVIEAGDGHEALTRADEHGERIDVLVSDVIMPEMHGPEVAEILRASRPDLKILFLSAYAEDLAEIERATDLGALFVAKPFQVADLMAKLRDLLGGPAEA